MGLLGDIAAGLVGGGAKGLIDGVADAIDRFVETDDERRAAEILLEKMRREPDKWQAEINKIEAAHRSLFVAGWRPFVGWTCGFGLAYTFVLQPLIFDIARLTGRAVALTPLDLSQLITILLAMLGMAGLRTHEKAKGLTR